MRHSRNLPRRAFERSDMNVRGSFDGSARSEVSKQHNQSHVTSVLSESIASPARRQYRTSETNEMAPRPAPANPVRSSSERPLSAGGAGVSAPSAAAPVIGNQVRRSLRRPSDGSTHSALTSSTAGLPVGGQQGASAAASAVGGSACSSTSSFGNLMAGPHNDITEIDQRIQALQSYLENARYDFAAVFVKKMNFFQIKIVDDA